MDFKLFREIYNQVWYVDPITIGSLAATLQFYRQNNIQQVDKKHNSFGLLPVNETVVVDSSRPKMLNDLRVDDKAVSFISLDGPVTKYGGYSHYGTIELANQLRTFDNDDRVIGHVMYIESGGGSAMAVLEMIEAMQDAGKPIVVWGDGIMASAAMYIASYGDYIFMHRGTDYVGSVGTMMEMQGFPRVSEDKTDGFRRVRVYATKSTAKNEEFEAAINDLKFEPVIEEILDPSNEQFHKDILANRPNVTAEILTGKIFNADKVVGTLIDEIGTFNEAVNKVLELSESGTSSNNNNLIESEMTVQELQAQHSDLYNSVFNAGVQSEQDRVLAYMEYVDLDHEAVVEGIESGKNPTQKFYSAMNRKQAEKSALESIKNDSPETKTTQKVEPKSKPDKSEAEQKELDEFEKEMNSVIEGGN